MFEVEGWLEEHEVAEVAMDGNKFAYYAKSNA